MARIQPLQYRSKEGDTLDLICFHVYGKTQGVVEEVLEANPELGPVLPVGTLVELPKSTAATVSDRSVLWR